MTGFTYDALGRVLTRTSRQGTGSAVTTTNSYDEVRSTFYNKGALTTSANPTATITYDYDNGARLAKRSWTIAGLSGTKTETTVYFPSGEVKYKTWPDGDATGSSGSPWSYDRAGRLYALPGISSTLYNEAGQVATIAYANGSETANSYSAERDWLTQTRTRKVSNNSTLQQFTYTRDDAGRILTLVSSPSGDNWTYTYDALDRLLTATNSADSSTSRTYTYNAAGSIATNSALGTYSYSTQGPSAVRPHAPTSVGGSSRTYDANGNLTAGAGATLTYDGDNRLTQVVKSGSTTVYAYGPDGSRIRTVATVGAGPAQTTWLIGASELDAASVWTKNPHPDIRKVGSSTTCYVHRDHLASVKLETGSSAAVVQRQREALLIPTPLVVAKR